MDDHWRAGAPGESPASTTTRMWRIVADVRGLDAFPATIPIALPVSHTRLLEELRSESVPDDGLKRYKGPPIGYSWQTVVHDDGQKEEVGNAGGVRGSFGEMACKNGCHYCFDSRLAEVLNWIRARRMVTHLRPTFTYEPPGLPRQAAPPMPQRACAPAPAPRVSSPIADHEPLEAPVIATTTSLPTTNLSAAAPDFDKKAYWKAREARAKAAIHALNIPTGPSANTSGSRVSNTGKVFGAKSIDYRPAALRKNDQRNRARMAITSKSKSPALEFSYTHSPPAGRRSPVSASTARSRERRSTLGSVDAQIFPPLPSPGKRGYRE